MAFRKKSQVWTIEFILSFLIFTAAIVLSVKGIVNIYANDNIDEVRGDSEFISQYLLSQGYPGNWTESTVIRPGFISENRIDSEKFISFYELDYSQTKSFFGSRSDFFVYFENASGNIPLFAIVNSSLSPSDGCGYGYSGVVKQYDSYCSFDLSSIHYDDMVTISRLTIYNSTIVKMNLLVWR